MSTTTPQTVNNISLSHIAASYSKGPLNNPVVEHHTDVEWKDLRGWMSNPNIGTKDGSYFCAGAFKDNYRNSKNNQYPHDFFILDGDSSLINGEVVEGAPDPAEVHKVLVESSMQHMIFSTHSNGVKGQRYRVLIVAHICSKEEQVACVFFTIDLLQKQGVMLNDVRENCTQGNAWLIPRVTAENKDSYYFAEHSDNCSPFPVQEAVQHYKRKHSTKSVATASSKGYHKGNRNNYLFREACKRFRNGKTSTEVLDEIVVFNQKQVDPLPEDEVVSLVESAGKYDHTATPESVPYPLTDVGLAERFMDYYGGMLLYVPAHRQWYWFNDRRWIRVSRPTEKVIEVIRSLSLEAYDESDQDKRKALLNFAMRAERDSTIKSVISIASDHAGMRLAADRFDQEKYLIGVENGVVDLRVAALVDPEQGQWIAKYTPIEFKSEAKAPQFIQFMMQIMGGDQEMVEYLKQTMGGCLIGGNDQQILLLFFGDGANGKSVLVEVISTVFGQYAMTAQPETFMEARYSKGGGDARPDIARLQGARLVIATESGCDDALEEGLVKQLTGGDKMVARGLRQDPVEFIPQLTPVLVTNHLPRVKGDGHAIWRRMIPIPFTQKFSGSACDPLLKEKLLAESEGILKWCIEGASSYYLTPLPVPKLVEDARRQYKQSNDLIQEWLADCCTVGAQYSEFSRNVYLSYQSWCKQNGYPVDNKSAFSQKLSKLYPASKKGGQSVRVGFKVN